MSKKSRKNLRTNCKILELLTSLVKKLFVSISSQSTNAENSQS